MWRKRCGTRGGGSLARAATDVPVAACVVPRFRFVAEAVLVTQQGVACCRTVLAQRVGFVPGGALVAGEGAAGTASKSSEKLPRLQVRPACGQGQAGQCLGSNIFRRGKACWKFFVSGRSGTCGGEPRGHQGQRRRRGQREQLFPFDPWPGGRPSPCRPWRRMWSRNPPVARGGPHASAGDCPRSGPGPRGEAVLEHAATGRTDACGRDPC